MNEHNRDESTPVELRAMESAVSDLGDIERAAAPTGLEARLFAATRHIVSVEEAPVVVARIGQRTAWFARLRIAASVAMVGGLAGIYLTLGPATPGSTAAARSLEEDMNYVLELRSADDGLAMMSEKIDTLFLDASSLGDSFNSDPTTSLLEGAS